MAWTQQQLDDLEADIASPDRVIEYQGKKIERRSLKELIALRDLMRREMGLPPAANAVVFSTFDKDLD